MSAIEKSGGKKDTFWGNTLGFVAAVASTPVALAKGAKEAFEGGSFESGFEEIMDGAFQAVKKFGDEHDDAITSGVTGAVTMVVLTAMTGKPTKS